MRNAMMINETLLRALIQEALQIPDKIMPNQAEINRADNTNELGPITIVKRRQTDGQYLVALVNVNNGKIVFDSYYEFVDDKFAAGMAAKRLLRDLDKFTGVVSPMSYKSRNRQSRKY